jgi:O-antigen/teichoic acid export membrane protein
MSKSVILLSLITLLGSAVNYGSNLAFARILTPASYGDLSSLLALSIVVAVPFAAIQTRIAGRVTAHVAGGHWDRVRYTVRHALAHVTVIALIATLFYCALIPVVKPLFHLQAVGPAIALAGLIFAMFMMPVLQGALQGMERWVAFGLVGLSTTLGRVAFGIPWALAGGGAGGAIGGQAIGILASFGGLLWFLRRHVGRSGSSAARTGLRRRPDVAGIVAGMAYVFFAVIANFDVVLAKIFLTPKLAGEYAALSTIGSVITYLPAVVAVVIVPNAIRSGESVKARQRVLRNSAAMVIVAALLAMIPALVAPGFVVRLMFGAKYLPSTAGVLPIVCAGGGLALLYLLVTYTVTIKDSAWTWMLGIGMLLQFGLIALVHHSVTQVAGMQATTVLVLLIVNEIWFHPLLPWPRRG